jgi:hypothetical protein
VKVLKACLKIFKIYILVTDICTGKSKSPDRRLVMQATAATQQCSKQTNNTEMEEGERIWCDFYTKESTMNRDWTKPNYNLRHTVSYLAVHGFHHKTYVLNSYYLPDENCQCELRDLECERYINSK